MDNFREARILLDTVLLGCYPAVDKANMLEQSKSCGDEKGRGTKGVDSTREPNYPIESVDNALKLLLLSECEVRSQDPLKGERDAGFLRGELPSAP
jgi:hypothetical protein